MKDIIVNWVKEDEELLEPYEWDEDDDFLIDWHLCMMMIIKLFLIISLFVLIEW